MADTVETIGTTLLRGDGGSPEVFTAVPLLRNMGTIGQSRGLIDVTHLLSAAREFRLALKEGVEMSFEGFYDPDDAQHAGLKSDMDNGTRRNFQIELQDASPGTVVSFTALVMNWHFNVEIDNVYMLEFTLKPTGDLTFA